MPNSLLRIAAFTLFFVTFVAFANAQVAINSVVPPQATTGQDITITGSGFASKPTVALVTTGSSKKYTLKVKSFTATQIVATLQTVAKGTFDVSVKVKKDSTTASAALTVPDPGVTDFTPTTAAPKDTVTINGDFFGSKKGKVLVNGKSAKVLTWTNIQITFVMPKLAAGSYAVVVDNKIGQAQAGNITCNVPPAPIGGPDRIEATANGTPLVVKGSFLAGTFEVATSQVFLNGQTFGMTGISIDFSFSYDLTNGTVPTVYNTGQGGATINYIETDNGNPNGWTSGLANTTYKITITGKTANSIEGTWEAVLPKSFGPGPDTNTITNGVFKSKLTMN
ncbi:MAG: IPT/TIG domain-containing protein [Planctomycetes bacterium]|nr:IPT/TIG domain-containing protein [Planctomycetota bacterium]